MSDSTQPFPPGELVRHTEFLKRLARGLLGDEQAAEDVAQDAFVLALERPPRAEGALTGWLARVARNLALNRQKGERRRATREERVARAEQDDTDQLAAERLELQRFVAERVARLDEAKRTALYLRYYEGLEPQAIAARLGLPVKTVKTRLARALAELRGALDARANGDRSAWAAALVPLAAAASEGAVVTVTGVLGGMLMKKAIVAAVLVLAAGVWWRREQVERPRDTERARGAEPTQSVATLAPVLETASAPESRSQREASAPVDAPDTRTLVRDASEPAASAAEATLVVQVVRKGTSEPLPGVALVLHEASAAWNFEPTQESRGAPGSLRTDANGRAEFQVTPTRAYRLEVNRSGVGSVDAGMGSWRSSFEGFAPGARREELVSLPTGFELVWCGRVVDGESQLPLAGARVERVLEDPFTNHTGTETTRSAGDGAIELRFASWAACFARIELEGYAPGVVRLETGHEQPSSAMPVRLLRAATLELEVTDPSGAPRSDVEVCASILAEELVQGSSSHSMISGEQTFVGRTGADGRCVLTDLPARDPLALELRVEGRSLRREERFLRLEPGERRELSWTVGGPCKLEGQTVEEDGRPAAGVAVWAVPETGMTCLQRSDETDALPTRSDAHGNFTLELAAGAWLVGPAPLHEDEEEVQESAISSVGTSLRIEPGQASAELRLTCWRGRYVTGRVLDPDGATMPNGFVSAMGDGGDFDQNFHGGAFALGPLPPGSYVLRANGRSGFASSEGVSVEAGAENVELVLRRAARLSVRVVDSQGRAVPDAMVWALASPVTAGGGGTFTQGDGTVTFPSLPPETYVVSASSPAGEFALLRTVVLGAGDARELELTLAPAAKLWIEILPRVEPRMSVEIRQDGLPLTIAVGSEYPAAALSPGEYELVLKGFRGAQSVELQRQRVRVAEAGETKAVFDLGAPR